MCTLYTKHKKTILNRIRLFIFIVCFVEYVFWLVGMSFYNIENVHMICVQPPIDKYICVHFFMCDERIKSLRMSTDAID